MRFSIQRYGTAKNQVAISAEEKRGNEFFQWLASLDEGKHGSVGMLPTGFPCRFVSHDVYGARDYTPSGDYCQIPPKGSFPTYADYLGTVLHELSHATMHPSRLDRKEGAAGQFGSEAYAKEELRAELASMFLSSELGVPGSTDNHAAYIESWLAALRKDKREIFRAAAEAQRIAEFVMGRKPEMRQKKDAQPMTPEGQAWADDYSRTESEEQGRQGFAARPSNQRPKSKWQPEAGFVVPTAPPTHQPAMGSDGLSGPN